MGANFSNVKQGAKSDAQKVVKGTAKMSNLKYYPDNSFTARFVDNKTNQVFQMVGYCRSINTNFGNNNDKNEKHGLKHGIHHFTAKNQNSKSQLIEISGTINNVFNNYKSVVCNVASNEIPTQTVHADLSRDGRVDYTAVSYR